jgi:catechol 2,3-dioxygenase-like lactoylglutathione lyase family enzyme
MAGPLEYQFNHIHVFCSDLAATERWFVDGVGAELVEHRESRGVPATVLRLGGAQIYLRPGREGEDLAPAGARHFGADHFGVTVSDVDATVAELKQRGVFVEVEPWDFSPGSRIAFIKGPDEVRIELVQPRR